MSNISDDGPYDQDAEDDGLPPRPRLVEDDEQLRPAWMERDPHTGEVSGRYEW